MILMCNVGYSKYEPLFNKILKNAQKLLQKHEYEWFCEARDRVWSLKII